MEANSIVTATKKKWPTPKKPPTHKHKKNTKFYNDNFHAFATEVLQALNVSDSTHTPNSYNEAIASPKVAEWIKAMQVEYGTLDHNGMFKLVLLPAGLCAIGLRWLFKIKHKASGIIDCLKVRWVSKGYAQQLGIDYYETFLPVVTMEHLQQLLTLTTILNLKVHQMDIENAFLNMTLSICIYIEQPQGFIDLDWLDHICLLHKSLYGLCQALLEWNRMMDHHLHNHHFLPTHTNPCIYVLQELSTLVITTVYVDDCVIIAPLKHIECAKMVLHDGF